MNPESKTSSLRSRATNGTKKKTGNQFNWFDALVALIIIAAILAGIGYFARKGPGAVAQTTKVVYQVEVQRVLEEIKDSARVGDEVRDAIRRFRLGKVVGVEVTEQTELVQNKIDGEMVMSVSPGRYAVVLTIEADAIISNGRVSVDSLPIAVGSPMAVRTAHFTGEGYCVGLKTE